MSNEQQQGSITWIKYDRENPPEEGDYLVTAGSDVSEAQLLVLSNGPWFIGAMAPPDKQITHYAHINLPEVQA
ncbi:hypothetical protein M3223_04180 [Paenibacillus pasadenensis]|uniref:hypothetical protein n=1 Tax=Paenibacillus pasadenensis TaxID=217090 RepID=UPI00203E28AC|nr:hypothetical protein [Paenibacillus pasadenensis]MCM3746547.1 hypothetical protein [Paenibacillus pasadenensis]